MRFQASWIMESVYPTLIDSIFFPYTPRPDSLLWFKKQGIKLLVNDPRESRWPFIKAFLENENEVFSEDNIRKFNRVIKQELDLSINPFKAWENKPFQRQQLDYLFYWREACEEISGEVQKAFFLAAVSNVITFWLNWKTNRIKCYHSPDEILEYFLRTQNRSVFPSKERVVCFFHKLSKLRDDIEASIAIIPFEITIDDTATYHPEEYFHAWFKVISSIEKAREDISNAMEGLRFSWKKTRISDQFLTKLNKINTIAIIWSDSGTAPKIHEEEIITPLINIFSSKYPKYRLFHKTSDLANEAHDFLLIFQR